MIENCIIALGNSYMEISLVSKMLNKSIDFKNKKNLFLLLFLTLYILSSYLLTTNVIRILITYFSFILVNYMLFKDSFTKIVVTSAIYLCLLFFSETIYVLLAIFVLQLDMEECKTIFLNSAFSNLCIFSILYFIVHLKFLHKIINKLLRSIDVDFDKSLIAGASLVIITFAVLMFSAYYKLSPQITLLLNIIIIALYMIISYYFMKEKNDNVKIKSEFQLATNNFKEFEKRVSVQSKRNHDTKNDLITIRGMLKNKSDTTDILDYMNYMASMERLPKDDEFLTDQIIYIPIPALKELIYQKMHVMKERNIQNTLSLDDSIKGTKEINWTGKKIKSICTVIGIYLDNAIEETEKIEDKEVKIEFGIRNDTITIAISNTFNGMIDFDQMEEDGYSSKGLGRGHGLNIAKEIIQKNDFLSHEIEIHGRVFCQILKIKM